MNGLGNVYIGTMISPDPAAEPDPSPAPAERAADPEPPPSIADGVLHPLDPRSVALHRTSAWIFTGVAALVLLVPIVLLLVLSPMPGWGKALLAFNGAAVLLGLAWLSHRWPKIEHRHASYKVDGQGVEIRKGVLWRQVINVPRSRVQHTDVSQGPLERGYGLGTLVIYTAGTDHAKVDLSGLDHGTALLIRDHLLPREDGDAV